MNLQITYIKILALFNSSKILFRYFSVKIKPNIMELQKTLIWENYNSSELKKLELDIKNKKNCTNLSVIMRDPNFLAATWARIAPDYGWSTQVVTTTSLNGIELEWFEKTTKKIQKGKFNFSSSKKKYLEKDKNKVLLRDKIIEEAMRFLLVQIFKNDLSKKSYGWGVDNGCLKVLDQIKSSMGYDSWYIKCVINYAFLNLDHEILVDILKTKIKDKSFLDLLHRYFRVSYDMVYSDVVQLKFKIIPKRPLDAILSSIYIMPFDNWVEKYLIVKYNLGDKIDRSIISVRTIDPNFIRLHYVRYENIIIMGLNGPEKYCEKIFLECQKYLFEKLKLTFNLEKTRIIDSQSDYITFLGYNIRKARTDEHQVIVDSNGKVVRKPSFVILDAPIERIIKKLIINGYAKKNARPTRNVRFINYNLYEIIKHYKMVEQGILDYYSSSKNYKKLVLKLHYLLKHSCALSIASKMGLKTIRRVFKKYGWDLNIFDEKTRIIIRYPTTSFKRPNNPKQMLGYHFSTIENYIDLLDLKI